MTTQYSFRRTEKKYRLSPAQYFMLLQGLAPHMIPDQFGLHSISSLYYDTDDHYLIRHSLEHPVFKEKLRLRSYTDSDLVFPEIKQKYKGVVYKRRIACTPDAWLQLQHGTFITGQDMQIQRELQGFLVRYPHLSPAVTIRYDRIAYAENGTDLRITFDQNLCARDERICSCSFAPILDDDSILMEVKTAAGVPLWLCHLLQDCRILPVSFSKYGRWYMNALSARTSMKG